MELGPAVADVTRARRDLTDGGAIEPGPRDMGPLTTDTGVPERTLPPGMCGAEVAAAASRGTVTPLYELPDE